MRGWSAERVAREAGARLVCDPGGDAPRELAGAAVDSRTLLPGELFVGLRGEREDGGAHAPQALAAGAWGALVSPAHARDAQLAAAGAAVLVHEHPVRGLQALAHARRAELRARGAKVIAITGSTGKTSTKDILAALCAAVRRTGAARANLNTEIGVPLSILACAEDCEVLVLEFAMRGAGQIAELAAIAEPDVGVIVNVGPAHLELLGSIEAIAAAKAELIAGLEPGAGAVLPAGEPLLDPHRRADLRTLTFGPGGDVSLLGRSAGSEILIDCEGERLALRPSFEQEHNLRNLLAAVAAARLIGITAGGTLEVSFTAMRGERMELGRGVTVIDDCYNANPMSMHAALDELARTASGRRIGVLGDMLELGPQAEERHRELGRHAQRSGVGLLVSVGPLAAHAADAFAGESHVVDDAAAAAALLPGLLRDGDTVLVKGSRGVGLERVVAALRAGDEAPARALPSGAGAGRR